MNISHIDLRQLRYFVAVAEELSFTRGAERLHMAQPPLSHQIRQLEMSLSAQLFKRTKRKVERTEAGTYLLAEANRLLRDVQETLSYTQSAARGHIGEVRIGINFSAPLYPKFPKLVARYRRAYPQARLMFREMFYADGIEALYNDDIDICFTRSTEEGARGKIQFQIFAEDVLELCLPRSHPLARRSRITIADLKDDVFLLSPRQAKTPLHDALQKLAHNAGFFLRVSQDTGHFPVMINLVAAGCGVAFLPSSMKSMGAGDVVFKKPADIKPDLRTQPLMLGFRRDDDSAVLKNFLALAKET